MSDFGIGGTVFVATSFAALSIAWFVKSVRISRARRIEHAKRMEYAAVFIRDMVSIASGEELVTLRQWCAHQRPRADVITVEHYDEAMRARQDARRCVALIVAKGVG